MKTCSWSYKRLLASLFFLLLCSLVACSGGSSTTDGGTTPVVGSGTTTTASNSDAGGVPVPGEQAGVQPCPAPVSEASHWDPIIGTQSGVNAVGRVLCAHLTGNTSLQAVVVVFYEGTGHNADVYIYNNVTSPNPPQIFKLQNLYKGDAKISNYNTLLTAEVDSSSKINLNQPNARLRQDLFREFKWSEGAGTLVPVSFPAIFPNLSRYEAENGQQSINQSQNTWKLNATAVASKLASQLLKWPTSAPTTIISGGGKHDKDAVVMVKNTNSGGGAIRATMSRLEGNTNNGIWEVTSVTSDGLSITSPQTRNILSSPFVVTGSGRVFEGKIVTVKVLDHLYTDITKGTVNATGTGGTANTPFAANVSYSSSFKGGAQEGLVVLSSYGSANGSISGAVMLKELLNA